VAGAAGADLDALLAGARAGRPRDIGRLVSLVENGSSELPDLLGSLGPLTGHANVIGVTGPPGVGKSTTTSALVGALRARGDRVAVVAVDPSSPFSGGALLGDRIRMSEHATDPGVFIRSVASRGHLGGLAATTPQVVRVLDAVGFDAVVVETVGVGQSEVEVAASADTTVVLVAPGMGDGVQAAKAGILEVADVLVVNKADLPGADATVRELRQALTHRPKGDWTPPIVRTVASAGTGIDDLVDAIVERRDWLRRTGRLGERRAARSRAELRALVVEAALSRIDDRQLDALAAQVADAELDVYSAVRLLLGD
jgi:LAO/AO transport system kinase